ncbi:hypothetical protein NDU88_001850 [Pleurodeles waltl]|uniref:Uncharacterized protein n=1 Tax=Pleurodeles waltl TaxID=8319 RepID=A0AAV7WQL3_PLEWA|nr:hypothetical protein NDU88_001849 [Pleurodeles waltl]KAJ1214225.1 hypothetical protein NDU88_001850 [Pleurodeles waltl]
MGEGPHVQSQRRGNGDGLRPKVPEIRSQVLEGSLREHQEGSLACTIGPSVEGDPTVSGELGGAAVAGVPPVLVSGSTTPSEGVQKSRQRVERGLRTPVENLEGQGSALRAEPPMNDLGETISGLGGIQTLSDGQRSGDLRQPDSCVALRDSVSLEGGKCAPLEVLVCQAVVQPQGGDPRLDDQVQRVNSDLVGGSSWDPERRGWQPKDKNTRTERRAEKRSTRIRSRLRKRRDAGSAAEKRRRRKRDRKTDARSRRNDAQHR